MTYLTTIAEYDAMTAQEKSAYRCAVETAFYAGIVGLECASRRCVSGKWLLSDAPAWNWMACVYRIARKPRERWYWEYADGTISDASFSSKVRCVAASKCNGVMGGKPVLFVEAADGRE